MSEAIGLAVVLLGCCAFGAWRRYSDGRAKLVDSQPQLHPQDVGAEFGSSATLLQFSSAFCAPCRSTRVLLSQTAEATPGVRHVEVDAESNLHLVRLLDIQRTPTTLLLDGSGRVRNRVVGVPRRDQLHAALDTLR